MDNVNDRQEGFIFINSQGQYAVTCIKSGHVRDTRSIAWVDSINRAEIFTHPGGKIKIDGLESCHSLPAVATRKVIIKGVDGE